MSSSTRKKVETSTPEVDVLILLDGAKIAVQATFIRQHLSQVTKSKTCMLLEQHIYFFDNVSTSLDAKFTKGTTAWL
jgi:hypothetical protein